MLQLILENIIQQLLILLVPVGSVPLFLPSPPLALLSLLLAFFSLFLLSLGFIFCPGDSVVKFGLCESFEGQSLYPVEEESAAVGVALEVNVNNFACLVLLHYLIPDYFFCEDVIAQEVENEILNLVYLPAQETRLESWDVGS